MKVDLLILTRKHGEGLFIGDDIRITVVDVRGKQIRLGIEAPAHVVVLREEIYRRIQEQNLKASEIKDILLRPLPRRVGCALASCEVHYLQHNGGFDPDIVYPQVVRCRAQS